MSFAKKAVKKVFKGVKKVVKKVWKPVLIGSAVFFTAGMAAPGFAGFATGGGLSGFLGSVGSTMVAGASALAGTLGLSSAPGLFSPGAFGGLIGGATAGTATTGGLTASGFLSGQAGINAAGTALASQAAGVGAAAAGTAFGASGVSAGGGGFFGAVGKTISNFLGGGSSSSAAGGGGLFSGPIGKMALFNGISGGIQSFMASEAASKERKRDRRRNFFGGPMRGGTTEGIDFPEFDSTVSGPVQNQGGAPLPAGPQSQFAMGQLPQSPQPAGILQPGNLDLLALEEAPVQFLQQPQTGGLV